MESVANSMGIEWTGIDGDSSVSKPSICLFDYTMGAYFPSEFDLVWCVEFVEHVEEKFVYNFLPSLSCGRVLLLTAAPPGHKGYHHVNCRPQRYWIDMIEAAGMSYDEEETKDLRAASTMKRDFVRKRGMVFVK